MTPLQVGSICACAGLLTGLAGCHKHAQSSVEAQDTPIDLRSNSPLTACAMHETGMQGAFKRVDLLSRPCLFVTYEYELLYMDVSRDAGFRRGPMIHRQSIPNAEIAVVPDGSRFFIGTNDGLLEFDNRPQLVRKLPISAFGVQEGTINWGSDASSDTLWFTVNGNARSGWLCEWEFNLEPTTCRRVGVAEVGATAFDKAGRRALVPYSSTIVDFSRQSISGGQWTPKEFTYAEFEPTQGLLLSNTLVDVATMPQRFWRNSKITHVDAVRGQLSEVAEGALAVWGPNGWVYFCVGDTQLWRCKVDGTQREPVYLATESVHYGHCVAPRFDHERERIAFISYWTIGKEQYSELVLIDLKTQEYRVKEQPTRFQNVAWVSRRE